MGFAMELACARGCAVSAWGPSSFILRMSSRPQRVTPGRRMGRHVRAGEEVGTEETVKAETEESQTPSIGTNKNNNGSLFPKGRKWTGYVEKDTAGQTNIYAVEPTVYVSESPISGENPEASSNNAAVAGLVSLVALASAASVLLTVGKSAPIEAVDYNGPPLSYYISKFSSEVPVEAEITVEDSVSAPFEESVDSETEESVPSPSEVPVAEEASA